MAGMKTGFVDKIPNIDGGSIRVIRRIEDMTGASVDLSRPAVNVNHTTETDVVPNYRPSSAPIWTAPDDELTLYQHAPLGRIGNALFNSSAPGETNIWARSQVEIVGHSSREEWLPADERQVVVLASLYAFLETECGIPRVHVWPDKLADGIVWAVKDNPRRSASKWGKVPGHFGHVEVPDGNSHWDPGSLMLDVLFDHKPAPPALVLRHQLVAVWHTDHAHADGSEHRHRELARLTGHVTLEQLGRELAGNDKLRAEIREHERKKHRIQLAHRRVREQDAT